jgi:regulatory protein
LIEIIKIEVQSVSSPKKLFLSNTAKKHLLVMKEVYSIKEAIQKIEHFCAYQERCHQEVVSKLWSMKLDSNEIDKVIVHLIEHNFLNEARFACSFARGKHRIKHWGKIRITTELKIRNINQTLINIALKEIEPEEYITTFEELAERNWNSITESNILKKRKKFCDYMLRRGFESNLIYEKVKELENSGQ